MHKANSNRTLIRFPFSEYVLNLQEEGEDEAGEKIR
jgi:hypothetical protein